MMLRRRSAGILLAIAAHIATATLACNMHGEPASRSEKLGPASAAVTTAAGSAAVPIAAAILASAQPAVMVSARDAAPQANHHYTWQATPAARNLLAATSTPPGFTRIPLDPASFGSYLRTLPLQPSTAQVRSFTGAEILAPGDGRLFAVSTLDIGTQDLQQCADSIIRLHAEWQWAADHALDITYPATSGDAMPYAKWRAGDRPVITGMRIGWQRGAKQDVSYTSFRSYLDYVFMYAGTVSLARDATKVTREALLPGDFLVQAGGPGHAVLVLDIASDTAGHRRALIGQGYMPAQSFHVVAHDGDPWFDLDGDTVTTPFWRPFPWSALRRLPSKSP
jgi:hypothetical protein